MWPKIKQNPRARFIPLSPMTLELRAKPVITAFVFADLAQCPGRNNFYDCLKISVPAPVLINRQQPFLLRRQRNQLLCFAQGGSEWFVDNDVTSSEQALTRYIKVAGIGSCYYTQTNFLIREHLFDRPNNARFGIPLLSEI